MFGLQTGLDQPSVYTGPFWNWFGMDLNGFKTGPTFLLVSIRSLWICSEQSKDVLYEKLQGAQRLPASKSGVPSSKALCKKCCFLLAEE